VQVDFWTATSGAVDFGWFPMFQRIKYFTNISQQFHLGLCTFALWLLQFYVLFRIPYLDEKITDSLAVVSLQHYLTVL
jgi:hypothetical protein